MIKIRSNSCEQTKKIGEKLSQKLTGNETIALFGDLGAGKTCLVRGIAKGLGVNIDEIHSPTFTLLNEYCGKFKVHHFDMYRIKTLEDLDSIGFFEYLDNGIVIIEWSENIEKFLPKDTIKIYIDYGKNKDERILNFEEVNDYEDIGY